MTMDIRHKLMNLFSAEGKCLAVAKPAGQLGGGQLGGGQLGGGQLGGGQLGGG